MEINMKSMIQIGLIIVAVMFVMKMMKGKRCEGFTQQQPSKVDCNCNIENFASKKIKKLFKNDYMKIKKACKKKFNKGAEIHQMFKENYKTHNDYCVALAETLKRCKQMQDVRRRR